MNNNTMPLPRHRRKPDAFVCSITIKFPWKLRIKTNSNPHSTSQDIFDFSIDTIKHPTNAISMPPKPVKDGKSINYTIASFNRARGRGARGRGGMHLNPAAMAQHADAALRPAPTTQATTTAAQPLEDESEDEEEEVEDEPISLVDQLSEAPATPSPPPPAGETLTSAVVRDASASAQREPTPAGPAENTSALPSFTAAMAAPSAESASPPDPSTSVLPSIEPVPQASDDGTSSSASENITVRQPAAPAAHAPASGGRVFPAPSPSPITPPPAAVTPAVAPLEPLRVTISVDVQRYLREALTVNHPYAAEAAETQRFVNNEIRLLHVENGIFIFTYNGCEMRKDQAGYLVFQAEVLATRRELAALDRQLAGMPLYPRLLTTDPEQSARRRAGVQMLSGEGLLEPVVKEASDDGEEAEDAPGEKSESDDENLLQGKKFSGKRS